MFRLNAIHTTLSLCVICHDKAIGWEHPRLRCLKFLSKIAHFMLDCKSGEMGVSAGKSNLKPRQKLDFSTKFKTNFTFSISLPFFNADSKPGKSHRFIVRSWDVTTDRRQFILFYLFYFFPFFFVLFCFYLHICVLVRTSGHMIVMWPESTW